MKERPPGISILAILHIIGGIVLAGMQVTLLTSLEKVQDPLELAGIPPMSLVLGMLLLAVLGIAGGIGMWHGKQWGWWLGGYYCVYSAFRNASVLLVIARLSDQLAETSRGAGYYYIKYSSRILIHLVILLYFFNKSVLAYFRLEGVSKWKAIASMAGACILVSVVGTIAVVLFR